MVLPPYLKRFYLPPPQFILLLGVRPQYLPVVLRLEVVLPLVDVTCRGLPAGLRFDTVVHWWGRLGTPWLLGTTSEFYSTHISIDLSTIMPLSPPPSTHPKSPVLLQGHLKPSRQYPVFYLVSSTLLSQCRPLICQLPGCFRDPRLQISSVLT